MKTLRESSKRLSAKYKFKRLLGTAPHYAEAYADRDGRINRVSPVKSVAILEPVLLSLAGVYEQPRVNITPYNTDWPFRIEYIEQVIDVDDVWVVVADGRNRSYKKTRAIEQVDDAHGISLDLIHIPDPKVVCGGARLIGDPRRTLFTEKQMKSLEAEQSLQTMIGQNAVWLESTKNPNQYINLHTCNILPHHLTPYNCSFYHRDVAHLYLDSLSAHFRRFQE